MERTSAVIRIGVACLGGLLLLALTARAKDAFGPDKGPLPTTGGAGSVGSVDGVGNGGGALLPSVFSPDPATLPKGGFPDSLPKKQDPRAKEGLEQPALPPPLTLTPGINVTLVVVAPRPAALRPAEFLMANPPKEGDLVRHKGYIGTVTLLRGMPIIDWGDGTLSQVTVSPPKKPAPFGQPVTFTATVNNSPTPTPSGDVKGVWKAPAGVEAIRETALGGPDTSQRFKIAENESPRPSDRVTAPQASGGDRKPGITAKYPGGGSFRTAIPIRMIAKDADGEAMPNAAVRIQDEAGNTVAAVTADAAGLVFWTPAKPGRYLFACASGRHIPESR